MTRLAWGTPGQRYYETGVDRGVLYLPSQPGVAWNGLVAISEAPTGGDPRPYYLDGVKYLNIASSEEFEAVIGAYSAPPEFAVCDGTVQIHNGLFATQQKRQSFGLSYRTLIGNDTESSDHGYKIHLVYNALAAPSTRTNTTMGDQAAVSAYSWKISTLPPAVTGIKRTAHFVIDTRYTDPAVLTAVEDVLYGTEITSASLPTPDELIAIFDV